MNSVATQETELLRDSELVELAYAFPNVPLVPHSIYEATPRGVGAVIGMENGFPTLRAILPGSPLEGTGIQPGDQIVEVRQGDGSRQNLYGAPLESALKAVRGEPGSELELRVLRRDPSSGQLQELRVPVRRAQLYLNGPASPGKN